MIYLMSKTWEVFAQSSEPEANDSLVYKTLTTLWLASVCHFCLQINLRNKQISVTFVSINVSLTNPRKRFNTDAYIQLAVRQMITAKDSRQKQQGFAAKAIVSCWLQSGDHRKRLTTEAARICSKNHRQLFGRWSPQNTHERSRNDSHAAKAITRVRFLYLKR